MPDNNKRTKAQLSAIMQKVKSSDTTPEILLRKALWDEGLRYRICSKNLPGKPDIVLPKHKVAIFIDGDFWHGGQWLRRNLKALEEQFSQSPSRNYWLTKIRKTMQRDSVNTSKILEDGWTTIRLWESKIREDLKGCVALVKDIVELKRIKERRTSAFPEKSFAEFFAGIGLMRCGLEKKGWSLKFANDIDEQKCEIYNANFEDAKNHLVCGDIHVLDVESIPTVTLATASFPCNDLSLAGARKGLHGNQSSAFWGFVEILKKMGKRKPPFVLLENVTGFLTSHGGTDFRQALLALNDLGYAVDTFILDASRFVPQSRQRLFVLGMLKDYEMPVIAGGQLQFFESDVRPKALADFIINHKEISWNIRALPAQPQRKTSLVDILEDLPNDSPEWWNKDRAQYLIDQMSLRHREIADAMMLGKEFTYGTVFRRVRNGKSMAELRTDGVAGCLRTPRGGSGRQILFKAGKGEYKARLLTPRECARLMGVDDFIIKVPLNQALFGFGDAVCVPVIEWIAENYLNPLLNELLRGRPLYPYGEQNGYDQKRTSA
jgi:DNA (cytosine-5)-methyltransferase 1